MRKRSPSDGRMRAGVRRRRTHVSSQRVARCISWSITSWRAAKNGRAERPAHTHPPKERRERHRPKGGPRAAVSLPPGGVRQAPRLCAGPGPFPPAGGACQLRPRHFCRPRSTGQRSGPPNHVLDKLLRPPPAWRGPWPQARLIADRIRQKGANEIVPGEGVAGPRSRLVREQGLPGGCRIPRPTAMRAGRTAGYMPHRRYKNSYNSARSTPCASRRGKRPALRREAGHWSGGPNCGRTTPRPAARGSMSPRPAPTLGSPIERGRCPYVPPRSGGTPSGSTYHGETPVPEKHTKRA